jgi:hypothetical protein
MRILPVLMVVLAASVLAPSGMGATTYAFSMAFLHNRAEMKMSGNLTRTFN